MSLWVLDAHCQGRVLSVEGREVRGATAQSLQGGAGGTGPCSPPPCLERAIWGCVSHLYDNNAFRRGSPRGQLWRWPSVVKWTAYWEHHSFKAQCFYWLSYLNFKWIPPGRNISPIFRWGNWGLERSESSPWVTIFPAIQSDNFTHFWKIDKWRLSFILRMMGECARVAL